MLWNRERKCIFTVRSAYRLAFLLRKEVGARANSSRERKENGLMWKQVWRLPVKPKLKHFLWPCIHNWLATSSVVKRKGMSVDDICKRCGAGKETREHLFFQCMESAVIWKMVPISSKGIQDLTCSFEEWWRKICQANKNPKFWERMELTVYILWCIWKLRCAWQFQGEKWEANEIIQKAMKEWHEFSFDIQQATAKGNPRINCSAGVEMEETTDASDLQGVIRIHVASEKQEGCLRHGVVWMVTS